MITAHWTPGGADINDALTVRAQVFGKTADERDPFSWHITVYDDGDKLAASARLVVDTDGAYSLSYIGVLPNFRGQGYGDLMLRALLFKAQSMGGEKLRAPFSPFLSRYGFKPTDQETMEMDARDIQLGGC